MCRILVRCGFSGLLLSTTCQAGANPLFTLGNGGPSGQPGTQINLKDGASVTNVGGGAGMGTGHPDDEINGISNDAEEDDGTICWSVDPNSTGVGGRFPIPGVNVRHQAVRNQQPGDAFLATEAWNIFTGLLPPPVSLDLFDNVLVINQAGGWVDAVGFGLHPDVGPLDTVTPGTPKDDVNGLASRMDNGSGGYSLFFTIANGSPSGLFLPGPPGLERGADIFFDPDITLPGDEQLFARGNQLGLLPGDDIDALVVFDRDNNRLLSPPDIILFSLRAGSPTLVLNNRSGADIFRRTGMETILFISNEQLGLRFEDEIDALRWDGLVNGNMLDTIDHRLNGLSACPADLSGSVNPSSPVYGRPDGVLDAADFFYFLDQFVIGNTAIADLTGSADPNHPGYGKPDGVIDASDFFYYLDLFEEGCT
ncbi:MAG: hypothetical protein KF866_03900 [Phycisphaeraceae bacterium]|nr:hypothetical protein [Phycisphaeraceae bacterium]MCW5753163.1 hypothetical protein [Phycisphaeraceae bacterium]